MFRKLSASSFAVATLLVLIPFAAQGAEEPPREVSVKSLSGPPSEFEDNRLPGATDSVSPSNLLFLDRQVSGLPTKGESAPQTFDALEGVGFSIVQATSQYPFFSPITLTAPDGSEYTFNGASAITCLGGPCDEYQAEILIEPFSQSNGGMSVFAISPGEVLSDGTWDLAMSPPFAPSRDIIEVESMIAFEEEAVSVGTTDCPIGQLCAEKAHALSFLEGHAPSLGVFYGKADGSEKRPVVLDAFKLEITEAQSRRVVHSEKIGADHSKSLKVDSFGRSIVPLPSLPVGRYGVRLDFTGRVDGDRQIRRTAFYQFPVIEKSLRLNGRVEAEVADERRLRLNVGMDPLTEDPLHVFAYAEVWSHDENRPIAWISGMTYPKVDADGQASLPMMLDARWLALAGVSGHQLSLRNLRVQDSQSFMPIDMEQELVFTVDTLPAAAFMKADQVSRDKTLYEGSGDITIPMKLAVASAPVKPTKTMDDIGVLLVHGWCSEPDWPISDFPGNTPELLGGTAEFSDPSASRSHDEFAQLIRDQGDQHFSDAFSVIGHSQGGAAALHLLAFYNSGLDHSTATRIIQSVGTPYRGTALMDYYLATGPLGDLIANIFGFCQSQSDLGTSGANNWQASIPTSRKRDVHYYRTHYERPDTFWEKLQFWRWRCNLASFVIPGVDDGVVSTNQAKLPGGIFDQGKTEGECHTGGMKHPDQKDNSARNEDMNRLARPLPGSFDFSADLICTEIPNTDYPYWTLHCNANVANGVSPFTYKWSYGGGGWFTGSSHQTFDCLNPHDPISLQVFDSEGEETTIDTHTCPGGIF